MKTYHIVRGAVTDAEAYDGHARVGDPEWQFSDGPPGERGFSDDFLSLEAGLIALSPAIFIMTPEYL